MKDSQLFISNQWHHALGSERLNVKDKYTSELIGKVPFATESEVELCLSGAVVAEKEFRGIEAEAKSTLLRSLVSAFAARKNEFVELLIKEAGKPRRYALAEVERSLFTLELSAKEALLVHDESAPMENVLGVEKNGRIKQVPIGVCLCITPFNFPLNLLMHKIGPALALGCPVIIKPSPHTPLTTQLFAEIVGSVGFPRGTFSVLHLNLDSSKKLVEDPRIKMISFTGSDSVGWEIKSKAYKKKVVLELGGNAAVIIDETACWENSIKPLCESAFMYAGQVCISTQRIYVHTKHYQQFCQNFCEEVKKIRCGDPQESETTIGPLIDKSHCRRIIEWINEAKLLGAEVLLEGRIDQKHNVMSPWVLTNTTEEMKVNCEEVFGPVVLIEPYETQREAIQFVNSSRYGLQAGVYTSDKSRFYNFAESLDVGAVLHNMPPSFRADAMPYGGVKDSGFGREGVRSKIKEMIEPKLLIT